MNKFDFKKVYKDLYLPSQVMMIEVPQMNYVMVEGQGNPNTSEAYKEAIGILYAISYTIKMSKMTQQQPEGYFDFVVPPLEGLWWLEDDEFDGMKITDKNQLHWQSMIRLPDFVTKDYFEDIKKEVARKKGLDVSRAKYFEYEEGLCVQMMHKGSYDDEEFSIHKMNQFIAEHHYVHDFSKTRFHHEIYLSDPRRTQTENLKTVIRHPIKKSD